MYDVVLYNYLHVLVINPFPQNLSVLTKTPFSRGSGIITKSLVQLAPDSATKSVPIDAHDQMSNSKTFCVFYKVYMMQSISLARFVQEIFRKNYWIV